MCLCYDVLGFAAHCFISGDDFDCDYPSDMDLTITLGMARTSRSAQTSSSIRLETLYDAYPVFECCCEDFYLLYFERYILLLIQFLGDTFEIPILGVYVRMVYIYCSNFILMTLSIYMCAVWS